MTEFVEPECTLFYLFINLTTHAYSLTVISESEIFLLRKSSGSFMRIEPKPTVQQLCAYSTGLSFICNADYSASNCIPDKAAYSME